MNEKNPLSFRTKITIIASFVLLLSASGSIADDEPEAAKKSQIVPKNIAGNYLSGEFARSRGNLQEAVRYASRVHREQPENMAVAVQLEGMLLLSGKIPEAIAIASTIKTMKENPDAKPADKEASKDPLADLLLVVDAIKNQKFAQAEELLKTSMTAGNVQLWAPLIKGWTQVAQDSLKAPLVVAMGKDSGRVSPLMNYHLALINDYGGFTEAAAKNYKDAVPNPENPSMRVMTQLLAFYQKNNAPKILAPVVKSFRDAKPEASGSEVTPIKEPTQGVAELLYSMGGLMYAAGGLNDAVIYLQLSLYLKPDFGEANMALGDAYGELQNADMSSLAYAKIPETSSYYNKAQLKLAINYDRAGKEKEALSLLTELAKKTPTAPDALVTKGDMLRLHEKFPEAIEAYTQALARVPTLNASHWPILFARGASYERVGKWPEAELDLQQALNLKPDQPDVLNYLGYGWLEQGVHVEQAQGMIAKAVKLRPHDPQIIDSMGWALYQLGDYKQAAQYLEKAIELLPADPTVNDHLGDVYFRMGRKKEARFQWERTLTYSPDAKLVESIEKKLREGLPPLPALANQASPTGTATP